MESISIVVTCVWYYHRDKKMDKNMLGGGGEFSGTLFRAHDLCISGVTAGNGWNG